MKSIISALIMIFSLFVNLYSQEITGYQNEDFFSFINDSSEYVKLILARFEENEDKSTEKIIKTLNDILNYSVEIEDKELQAETLVSLGKIYENISDYKNALINYEKASYLIEKNDFFDLNGYVHTGLSNVWWRSGNYTTALEYSLKSIEIFKELSDTVNLIYAYTILAGVYIDLQKVEKAENIYGEMLNLSMKINDSSFIAQNYEYLGVTSFYNENFKEAIEYYKKSLEINKQINKTLATGINYGNIAEAYEHLNKLNFSLSYYLKAIKIEESHKFYSGLIFLYYGIANTYSKMGKWRFAEQFFNKSLKLTEDKEEDRELLRIYQLLSSHYVRKNDFKNAYEHYVIYSNIKDSIYNIQKNEQIEKLRIKYELDNIKTENSVLLKEKHLIEDQVEANKSVIKLQYIIGSVIFLGLIASIIFTFVFSRQKRRLKKSNNTKDKLFSIIGHDLRGPIGTNKELLNIIFKKDLFDDQDKLKSFMKSVQLSLDSINNLLEDILNWSKADQRTISYNPSEIKLRETVSSVFSLLDNISKKKSIKLINEIPADTEVLADQNLLSTIIRNLVSNAIKFTKSGGKIEVNILETELNKSKISPYLLTVFIKDNGVGISEENFKKLFDKNTFFSSYGTDNEKGIGLGLKLCKEFAHANKGKLWAESKLGIGSIFYFTVPYKKGKF